MNTQAMRILQGRYNVGDFIGQGGLAVVHEALDMQTGRRCVVKELLVSRARDLKDLELFEREIRVLSNLDHDRIPKLYDHFTTQEPNGEVRFYLIQEYIEGQNLEATIQAGGRFTVEKVINIGLQVVSVLVYLHRLRPPLIHRDIKPSNLILRPGDGRVFVIDFGAVRDSVKDQKVGGSTVVGTFGYMAPEQFRGLAEPATDVYALGATLLYLLTGREPSDFDQEMLRLDLRTDSGLDTHVIELLEAMLEPDVKTRNKYMPFLLRGFERVRRGQRPFGAVGAGVPGHVQASEGAKRRAHQERIRSSDAHLPEQVRKVLSPEIVEMTDSLRNTTVQLVELRNAYKTAKGQVSFLDWMNVFSESDTQRAAREKEERFKALEGQQQSLRLQWRQAIRGRARLDPLYVLSEEFSVLYAALSNVSTKGGTSSMRRECPLYNYEPVYESLGRIAEQFQGLTGLRRSFAELDARIQAASVEPSVDRARRQLEGLSELERGIVERAVGKLRASNYPQLHREVSVLSKAHTEAKRRRDVAEDQVSFWDWVNVFSDSPEQVRLEALSQQLGGVWNELSRLRGHIQTLYQQATAPEPVFRVLYSLENARRTAAAIRAVSTSHTRTYTTSSGRTRRERYYKCSVRGVDKALSKARDAEASVWEVLQKPLSLENIETVIYERL